MSTPFIDLGLFCGMGAEEGADLFYRLDKWKLQAFVLKYSDPSTAENAWRPRARYNEYLTNCCQPYDGPDATLHDSDNQATDDEPASGYISLHGCRTDDGPHSRNGKVANPVTADVSISRLIFYFKLHCLTPEGYLLQLPCWNCLEHNLGFRICRW